MYKDHVPHQSLAGAYLSCFLVARKPPLYSKGGGVHQRQMCAPCAQALCRKNSGVNSMQEDSFRLNARPRFLREHAISDLTAPYSLVEPRPLTVAMVTLRSHLLAGTNFRGFWIYISEGSVSHINVFGLVF